MESTREIRVSIWLRSAAVNAFLSSADKASHKCAYITSLKQKSSKNKSLLCSVPPLALTFYHHKLISHAWLVDDKQTGWRDFSPHDMYVFVFFLIHVQTYDLTGDSVATEFNFKPPYKPQHVAYEDRNCVQKFASRFYSRRCISSRHLDEVCVIPLLVFLRWLRLTVQFEGGLVNWVLALLGALCETRGIGPPSKSFVQLSLWWQLRGKKKLINVLANGCSSWCSMIQFMYPPFAGCRVHTGQILGFYFLFDFF